MTLDWPNLVAGAGLGFMMGILANMWYGRYHANQARAELRKKYAPIAGTYTAYLFVKDSDNIDYDNPCGKCRITYEKENILHLHYEEIRHDHIWEAAAWMENPSFGSLAWRYVRLQGREPPSEHRYGFKRCIVTNGRGRNGEPRRYFYLEGEAPFGKEAMEKDQ